MRWLIRQLETSSNGAFQFSGGFKYQYLPREEVLADVITTDLSEEFITLRAASATVTLVFHTHAWCGSVYLSVGGEEKVICLYAEEHGYRSVPIEVSDETVIKIRTGAPAHPEARGAEVWLVAVEFSEAQNWVPRSMPITPRCSITHGACGTYITLSNDAVIGASIVCTGIWAPKDVDLFRSILRPGMVALDVGANIGHHTVLYSKLVGPTGRVVAYEPQTVIFRLLSANAVINGCDNVDIVQACVGEAEGELNLFPVNYSAVDNFGALGVDPASLAQSGAVGERCAVTTLELVSWAPRPAPPGV